MNHEAEASRLARLLGLDDNERVRLYAEATLAKALERAANTPGAALVKLRWDKTTAEERTEFARKIARARWGRESARKPKRTPHKTAGKI